MCMCISTISLMKLQTPHCCRSWIATEEVSRILSVVSHIIFTSMSLHNMDALLCAGICGCMFIATSAKLCLMLGAPVTRIPQHAGTRKHQQASTYRSHQRSRVLISFCGPQPHGGMGLSPSPNEEVLGNVIHCWQAGKGECSQVGSHGHWGGGLLAAAEVLQRRGWRGRQGAWGWGGQQWGRGWC